MPKVKDGASLRKNRLEALLFMIDAETEDPPETLDIQVYMMRAYGLKFETTIKYLKELQMAGLVRMSGQGWVVTQRFKKYGM